MIISVNWLKKYTDVKPIDELVELIGARLVEVESVEDITDKYQGIIVAKVVDCSPVEGSDHLSLAMIDDGGVVKGVDRDGRGLVQVVCGAPNVRAGLSVAWLPPGVIVPSTFSDKEPFRLAVKDLKGIRSHGMLASAAELDLYADHSGILEVDKNVAPGSNLAEVYELGDYLLDIENKSLTHRPDTFGVIGFAREVAAIQGEEFVTPDWLAETEPQFEDAHANLKLAVKIDDKAICERYQAAVLSGVSADAKTPVEIQTYLARVGVRPISPVVDVTNYLMMLTGQPLHAFDYDKLVAVAGGKADIHVRLAREGEELMLLDGKIAKLSPDDIVIAAGDTAVGLAGAMGGANTEIDASTKNIIIESATFNLYSLRATQMRHGIFSEAITRFTKGQPAALTAPVLAKAIDLLGEWTGAVQISKVAEDVGKQAKEVAIELTVNKTNSVLGSSLSQAEILEVLQNAEFAAAQSGKGLITVSPPYWRHDINIVEDVIEEVGRVLGFDSIAPTLPLRDLTPADASAFDKFRFALRRNLEMLGANEVLTYSFVHGDMLIKAGQSPENSYRIVNSVSPDLQYYRQSLTPSLLDLTYSNVKQGYEDFALYEINKTHAKSSGLDKDKMPVEQDSIALTLVRSRAAETVYYDTKLMLDVLAARVGVSLVVRPMNACDHVCCTVFENRRSGHIYAGDQFVGVIGEYRRAVQREFKLPAASAGFEIDSRAMFNAVAAAGSSYTKLSRYPSTTRDICFKVAYDTTYADVYDIAKQALASADDSVESSLTPVDIYVPEDRKTKNVTLRVGLTSHDHTLTSEEANQLVAAVSQAVVKATGAEVV